MTNSHHKGPYLQQARFYLSMLQRQLEDVEHFIGWANTVETLRYPPNHADFVRAQEALSFKRSDEDSGLRESADSNLNRLNRTLGILVSGVEQKPKSKTSKRKPGARR
jgi:hypothetical protein